MMFLHETGIIGGRRFNDGRYARVYATGELVGGRLRVPATLTAPVTDMIRRLVESGERDVTFGPYRAEWKPDGP